MIQIEPALKSSFASCEFIESQNAFRCERTFAGRRRAVYFFAAVDSLPSSEQIESITLDLVSPSYFKAQDSSRWSHYLVFVAPDEAKGAATFRETKYRLETDRAYSRKFLICKSELKSFLDTSVSQNDSLGLSPDLLSTWVSILTQHGLGEIAAPGARAPIVRSVQFGTNRGESLVSTSTASPIELDEKRPPATRFLRSLSIKRFGLRKVKGDFSFGTVNLIRGPNGSGKTSLLESIEHFICGATLRSPGADESLEAVASFPTRPEVTFQPVSSKKAQERDLHWYGRAFSKGNHLPEGFARYNFLNTDAAVEFSHDEDLKDLQTALSKISLGPNVSFVWDRLAQFEQDFSSAVSPLASAIGRVNSNLLTLRARIEALSQPSPLFGAQVRRFAAEVVEIGFKLDESLPSLVSEDWLAQFTSLRELASNVSVAGGCATIAEVLKKRDLLTDDLRAAKELIESIRSISLASSQQSLLLTELNQREGALQSALKFVKANVPGLLEALREVDAQLGNTVTPPVALSELSSLAALPDFSSSKSAGELRRIVATEKEKTHQALRIVEEELARLRAASTELASLLSEVRALGQRVASLHPDLSACPLCQTRMERTELLNRIASVAFVAEEAPLQSSHERFHESSMALLRLNECEQILDRLFAWQPLLDRASLDEIVQSIEEAKLTADQLLLRKESIVASLRSLESVGLKRDEYEALESSLSESGVFTTTVGLNEPQVLSALEFVANERVSASVGARDIEQQLSQAKVRLGSFSVKYSALDDRDLIDRINGELNSFEEFLRSFNSMPMSAQEILRENLASKSPQLESLAKLLSDLNREFQSERSKNSDLSLVVEQRDRDEVELARLTKEHGRLESALNVIRGIRQEHSLEAGMSDFIDMNLASIQRIFERLHLPKELKISNLANCNLEREGQLESVQLNQISTGQRAALVLSIFFTLNLSLKNGPPMMLIDDPVAHVDDLNTLSFLDFLADIAESKSRQIFFATANEKLANLFAKKMEFLGADLQVVDLRTQSG